MLKTLFDGALSVAHGLLPARAPTSATLHLPVLRRLDEVEVQWARPEMALSDSWFHQEGKFVAFTPTLSNGAALTINGQTTTFVPTNRFADFLVNMREQVTAGVFDSEIEAGLRGFANVSGLAKVAMPQLRKGTSKDIRRDQNAELLHRQRDAGDPLIQDRGE